MKKQLFFPTQWVLAADRNFKRPSGSRLPTTFVARNQPYVASKLRGRVACLANRAAGAPLRRAPGH